jgi:membrane AbrB-like protein
VRGRTAAWAALVAVSLGLTLALMAAGLPAALLLGPMIAGIAVAFGDRGISVPTPAFRFAQALVGLMIARILAVPVLVEILEDWPVFVVGVISVTLAAAVLGYGLARLRVLPETTAVWGSSPGAASAMMLMSASFGADMRLVAFMQYTRVVVVATAAAVIARIWGEVDPVAEPVAWLAAPDWGALAITLALAAASGWLGLVSRLPSGTLILPLAAGTVLQNVGLVTIELPQILLAAAFAVVGWSVGLRFDRETVRHAARAFPAVLASIVALVAICAGFAALLVVFGAHDPLTAYLAMSPGGADTVAIIASSTRVDVAFVMAMQTARLIFVLLTGPAIARFVARRVPPGPSD